MSRKGSSKYPDELIEQFIEYYNKTLSVQKVADQFGVPWGGAYGVLKRRGVIRSQITGQRFNKHTEADVLLWAEDYKKTKSARQTGLNLGIDPGTVVDRLRAIKIIPPLKSQKSKPQKRKHTDEVVQEWAEDYKKTGSTRITGKNFGVQPSTVHRYLKKLGLVPALFRPEEEKKSNFIKNTKARNDRMAADPDLALSTSLRKHHGNTIDLEDYKRMMVDQCGRCAICSNEPDTNAERKANRRLFVDHDHQTEAIRQLLCFNCNSGIGHFQDNPIIIVKAIQYLERVPVIPFAHTFEPTVARKIGKIECEDKKRQNLRYDVAKFRITIEQYEQLVQAQNSVCAICSRPPTWKHRLAIDHNHTTGDVRGLLESACNLGLGHFKDSPTLLQSAIDYLNKHKTPQTTTHNPLTGA